MQLNMSGGRKLLLVEFYSLENVSGTTTIELIKNILATNKYNFQ